MSRSMLFLVAPMALVAVSGASFAADPKIPEDATTVTATVFGNDPCPKPKGDEIIVCGRLPESERYRIPKALRKKEPDQSGAGASWGSRVETLEAAQRFTMPGSCTAVGSFGHTGCTQAMLRQWFLERRAARAGQQP